MLMIRVIKATTEALLHTRSFSRYLRVSAGTKESFPTESGTVTELRYVSNIPQKLTSTIYSASNNAKAWVDSGISRRRILFRAVVA